MNTTKLWHVETHWNSFFRHTPFMASGYGVWERGGSQFPPPPPEGNCRGAAHAFSLCSAPCSHANGDKPTVFGLLPPLELLLPHQAEAYLSTLSWIPFGCRKTSGLHIKAHHNSVVLPQVSLGGSVTWLTHFMHHPIRKACDPSSFFCSITTP